MAYHVVSEGQVYRLTKEAWKRVLLSWARTGQRPDFTGFAGVKPVGEFLPIDAWTLHDVEIALVHWLRTERA